MAVTINGTTGIVTPTGTGDVSVGDDLTFTGTGNRITGDFSNATHSNRTLFQTSTANSNTAIGAIPVGTGNTAQFIAYGNGDPANSSYLQMLVSATEARINSGQLGAGTNLPMTFYTGGSERVRIDTAGNVGIGTSSVAAKFHVNTAASTDFLIGFGGNLDNYYTAGASGIHVFRNGITERARIDSSGNLLVGTTTGVFGAKVRIYSTTGYTLASSRTGTGFETHLIFENANGGVGNITTTGSSTSYNTSSDYRLKENVQPMQGALEKVAQLKPCTYTWKADGSDGQGFIAHELQAVVPDAVTGEKDAVDKDGKPVYQGVDTSFLVATLTAAIQEQQAIIQDLKARIEVLEQA